MIVRSPHKFSRIAAGGLVLQLKPRPRRPQLETAAASCRAHTGRRARRDYSISYLPPSASQRQGARFDAAYLERIATMCERPRGAVRLERISQQRIAGLVRRVRPKSLNYDYPTGHIDLPAPALSCLDAACRLVDDAQVDATHTLDTSER